MTNKTIRSRNTAHSNTEISLAMFTLDIWSLVVQFRYVSPHNFDGLAMSGLAFSVAPFCLPALNIINLCPFDLEVEGF